MFLSHAFLIANPTVFLHFVCCTLLKKHNTFLKNYINEPINTEMVISNMTTVHRCYLSPQISKSSGFHKLDNIKKVHYFSLTLVNPLLLLSLGTLLNV